MAFEAVKSRIFFVENPVGNMENEIKKLSHNSKENTTTLD